MQTRRESFFPGKNTRRYGDFLPARGRGDDALDLVGRPEHHGSDDRRVLCFQLLPGSLDRGKKAHSCLNRDQNHVGVGGEQQRFAPGAHSGSVHDHTVELFLQRFQDVACFTARQGLVSRGVKPSGRHHPESIEIRRPEDVERFRIAAQDLGQSGSSRDAEGVAAVHR